MKAAITAVAVAVGLAFVVAMFMRASHNPKPGPGILATQPAATGMKQAAQTQGATSQPGSSELSQMAKPGTSVQGAAEQAKQQVAAATQGNSPSAGGKIQKIAGLHVKALPGGASYVTLGSADPKSKYDLAVRLVPWGAAVDRITLSKYSTTVQSSDRYMVCRPLKSPVTSQLVYPLAAMAVQVNGQWLDLDAVRPAGEAPKVCWAQGPVKKKTVATDGGGSTTTQSVTYRATIVDGQGKAVLAVDRTYTVTEGSYDIALHQKVVNLSGKRLSVVWRQYAQGDVPLSKAAYLGDRRMFVTGYFTPTGAYSQLVTTTDGFTGRNSLIKTVVDAQEKGAAVSGIWPNANITAGSRLVWLGAVNRYFAMATHPLVAAGATQPADVQPLQDLFPTWGTVVIPSGSSSPDAKAEQRAVAFTMTTGSMVLDPGSSRGLDMGVYAGPRDSKVFAKWPYKLMSFNEMIRYEIECSWITFQWLAKLLLALLKGFHFVVQDWGVSIILLVVLVRALLHPITKRSQINMMKMGKAMQSMQPEMEKLKKKYKDDQSKLNQEMMKLYREKGVNPMNMLGCLPMLLQTPIWIALYAMLYFAIELRHQPAFYGVFQAISGGHWRFLADLSTADHFWVVFKHPHPLNLILIHPNFQAINLLPLLMAVVFFFQQKFMTPPAATEQAQQQQKMMKFMVLLFPIMLYSLPSGLNLYILASTAAGVVDSYIVRKHVKEQEAAGTLFTKKEKKKGGFMDRMQQSIAQKQRELEKKQQRGGGKRGK